MQNIPSYQQLLIGAFSRTENVHLHDQHDDLQMDHTDMDHLKLERTTYQRRIKRPPPPKQSFHHYNYHQMILRDTGL